MRGLRAIQVKSYMAVTGLAMYAFVGSSLAQDCPIALPAACFEVETRVSLDIPPWTVPTTKTYRFDTEVFFVRSHLFELRWEKDGNSDRQVLQNGRVTVTRVKEFDCPERAVKHSDWTTGHVIFYSCEAAIPLKVNWPGGVESTTSSSEIVLARDAYPVRTVPNTYQIQFSRPFKPLAGKGIVVERLPLGAQAGPTAEDGWTAAYCRSSRLEQQHKCEVDARDREISDLRNRLDQLSRIIEMRGAKRQ